MFSTQESVDCAPSLNFPQESASPVRKKGRNRNFLSENASSRDIESANPFGFSQDSMVASQFSQNFAERMGQMNMFCSQDNSNMSSFDQYPVSSSCASDSNTGNGFHQTLKMSGLSVVPRGATAVSGVSGAAAGGAGGSHSSGVAGGETERAIDIAPPVKNIYLTGVRPHCELYFDPSGGFGEDARSNKKAKRPTKVWIGAFKDRPRIITEFEELKMLGEGTFSTVMCVRHRLDGTLYAVKRVREAIVTERQGNMLLREVNALAALQGCPHVVRYYGSWVDSHHLFIQTELCHLGTLEDLISPKPSPSSIICTASMALRCLQTDTSSQSYAPLALVTASAQNRNRSESFNSIDLNNTDDLLLEDECLTAPGPTPHLPHQVNKHKQQTAVGNHDSIKTAQGMLPQTASTYPKANSNNCADMMNLEDNNSGNGLFFTQPAAGSYDQLKENAGGQDNMTSLASETAKVSRGIGEDLAWLILFDVAQTLSYMHARDMVHLDLRPANIFLTTSCSYHTMDTSDPQYLLVKAARLAAATADVGCAVNNAPNELFASILSAAPLKQHSGGSSGESMEEHNADAVGSHKISNKEHINSTDQKDVVKTLADYDVRGQVEEMLVQRKYLIRIGDFGHCCRVDERSAIQEGQTRYCARELINMEEEQLDCTKADIFSLGASVYELCLGRFLGAEGEEGIAEWHSIRDGKLDASMSHNYSAGLVKLLQKLMHPLPSERPSAPALSAHLLHDHHLNDVERKRANFPPTSLEDMVARLHRENAELRAKLC